MKKLYKTALLTVLGLTLSAAARADGGGEETGCEPSHGIWISDFFRIDGAVKTRMEVDMNDPAYRFAVINTRFGILGNLNSKIYYRIQLELDREGTMLLLDSYVEYRSGRWDLRLGQQANGFSVDMVRAAWLNPLPNRSLQADYISSYTGSQLSGGKVVPFVRSIGPRDLGFRTVYSIPSKVPVCLAAGVFNGSGLGTQTWGKRPTLLGRVDVGSSKGLRGALSYYDGVTPQHTDVVDNAGTLLQRSGVVETMRMVGTELRYVHDSLTVEGEYSRRYLGEGRTCRLLTAAFVQAYYRIPVRHNNTLSFVMPVARWDFANGLDYLNTTEQKLQTLDVDRMSLGFTLGFASRYIHPELRFGYEKFFVKDRPSDFSVNRMLHDKVTVDVVLAF